MTAADEFTERLRRALHAEVAEIVPAADALDRIQARAASPHTRDPWDGFRVLAAVHAPRVRRHAAEACAWTVEVGRRGVAAVRGQVDTVAAWVAAGRKLARVGYPAMVAWRRRAGRATAWVVGARPGAGWLRPTLVLAGLLLVAGSAMTVPVVRQAAAGFGSTVLSGLGGAPADTGGVGGTAGSGGQPTGGRAAGGPGRHVGSGGRQGRQRSSGTLAPDCRSPSPSPTTSTDWLGTPTPRVPGIVTSVTPLPASTGTAPQPAGSSSGAAVTGTPTPGGTMAPVPTPATTASGVASMASSLPTGAVVTSPYATGSASTGGAARHCAASASGSPPSQSATSSTPGSAASPTPTQSAPSTPTPATSTDPVPQATGPSSAGAGPSSGDIGPAVQPTPRLTVVTPALPSLAPAAVVLPVTAFYPCHGPFADPAVTVTAASPSSADGSNTTVAGCPPDPVLASGQPVPTPVNPTTGRRRDTGSGRDAAKRFVAATDTTSPHGAAASARKPRREPAEHWADWVRHGASWRWTIGRRIAATPTWPRSMR